MVYDAKTDIGRIQKWIAEGTVWLYDIESDDVRPAVQNDLDTALRRCQQQFHEIRLLKARIRQLEDLGGSNASS